MGPTELKFQVGRRIFQRACASKVDAWFSKKYQVA